MIFAAILAGGVGSRMGGTDTPKQFLTLGDKPVIIHTIEKFVINSKFDKILVLSPPNFINHTNNLINEYFGEDNNIVVLKGGIIVTHDSVRPFVTHRIIEDNINAAIEFGACDTVVPATDTIVESVDGEIIKDIPLRDNFYQGQTPQSFKINKLYELINSLSDNETNILTDACKIFVLKGEDVHLVEGEITNIKITYPYDLKLANTILKE